MCEGRGRGGKELGYGLVEGVFVCACVAYGVAARDIAA